MRHDCRHPIVHKQGEQNYEAYDSPHLQSRVSFCFATIPPTQYWIDADEKQCIVQKRRQTIMVRTAMLLTK